jgi:hypothetical protein
MPKTLDDFYFNTLRNKFQERKREISSSYRRRKKAETLIWNGFENETNRLLAVFHSAFQDLTTKLFEAGDDVYIEKFTETYNPKTGKISVDITNVRYKGKIYPINGNKWEGYCPHKLLESFIFEKDKRVRKFKKDFFVETINEPKNECKHL